MYEHDCVHVHDVHVPVSYTHLDVYKRQVLVEVLNNDEKIGQEFQVVSGDVEIKEAVDQFNQ